MTLEETGTQKLENTQIHKSKIFKCANVQEADGDGTRTAAQFTAPRSTEDLRPHIAVTSVGPFKQEKEGGPRCGTVGYSDQGLSHTGLETCQ